MYILKWRNRKKDKQNGCQSYSTTTNPISIVGALSIPAAARTLAPTCASSVTEDEHLFWSSCSSHNSLQINGDLERKPRRKTSRVSFRLGPAIIGHDLPNKCQSECGTVSSARFPNPAIKTASLHQSTNNPTIIENFNLEAYTTYVINARGHSK